MTTNIEVTKIEEQAKGRLLFSVRAHTAEGRIEFPIAIQELGSPVLDEAAVLKSTLDFAEELTAAVRLRLRPQAQAPARLSAGDDPKQLNQNTRAASVVTSPAPSEKALDPAIGA